MIIASYWLHIPWVVAKIGSLLQRKSKSCNSVRGEDMATSLDDLVNMTGVILAFEFTPDGTCTSYNNVTREMAAMICRFCAAVTMNFNALASGFTELSEQQWVPQKGWIYVGGSHTVILGRGGYRGVFAESSRVSIDEVSAALAD
jgi:roadblock/LC7 domain-containing protein